MTALSDATKLRLLLEISNQIRSQVEESLNLDATLELILRTVTRLVPYDTACIRLTDQQHGFDRTLVRTAEQGLSTPGNAGSPAPDRVSFCDKAGLASIIDAPIIFRERTIGSILVGFRAPDKYTTTDTEILEFFATEVSFTIEKALLHEEQVTKKKMESELELTRQVQVSLFPAAVPKPDGFDIAAVSIPAAGVGGDYYDFIQFPENNMGLVIADVVGKGMSAALIMASFRAFLRAQIRNDYAIATIFRKVNVLLKEGLEDNRFVTAVYGVLNVPDRVLTYCNAGHNPPLLVHADGSVEGLSRGGMVMGLFDGAEYKESRRQLKSGDVLVLYTDGLAEAINESEEEYGTDRLIQAVRKNRLAPAQALSDLILEDVSSHRGETPLHDDLTLIVVKAL